MRVCPAPEAKLRVDPRLLVLAATAVALLLRALDLDLHGLWLDELFTWRVVAREDVRGLLEELRGDVHPPLYFLALRAWVAVAGDGEIALRLPSVLAGTALVPATWWLGRSLVSARGAVIAAWLVATAPFLVELHREARANALLDLLAVVCWAWACRPGGGWAARAGLGLVAAALVWVHPFGYFAVFGGLLVALSGDPAARRAWAPALLVGAATGALWWPALLGQAAGFAASPWYALPSADPTAWLAGELSLRQPGVVAWMALGGLLGLRRIPGRSAVRVGLVLVAMLVVPYALSIAVAPVLRPRSVSSLVVLAAVLAGGGFGALRPAAAAVVWGGLAAAAGLVGTRTAREAPRNAEQWREAAALVAAGHRPGDIVVGNHPQLWAHYLPSHIVVEPWEDHIGGAAPDGFGKLWLLAGHTPIRREGAVPAPEDDLTWVRHLPGATVGVRVTTTRPVLAFDVPDQSMAPAPGRVSFWWNSAASTGPLELTVPCRLAVAAHGDTHGGPPAQLAWAVHRGEEWLDGGVLDAHEAVPGTPVELTTLPVAGRSDDLRVRLSFVNDGEVVGPEGVVGDRNLHVASVVLRCGGGGEGTRP